MRQISLSRQFLFLFVISQSQKKRGNLVYSNFFWMVSKRKKEYLFQGTLMGLSGLEPPTSRLSGVRSNRLSYKPICFTTLLYYPTFSITSSLFFSKFVFLKVVEKTISCLKKFLAGNLSSPLPVFCLLQKKVR